MYLTDAKVRKLHLEVSEAYNMSPLAIEDGWRYTPNEFSILELKTILKYLPDRDSIFLDIGTGRGIVPIFIKKLGIRSISVDSFAVSGVSAIKNVNRFGVEGYLCEVGREMIPIESGSVDCVLIADVIEHLIHSPKPILNEIHRLLKPDGVCVATTPNATRLTVRLKVLLGYSNWANIYEYFDEESHFGHHHEYSMAEFKEVFRRTKFKIEDSIMYEDNLRTVNIKSLCDAGTRNRSRDKRIDEATLITAGKKLLLDPL